MNCKVLFLVLFTIDAKFDIAWWLIIMRVICLVNPVWKRSKSRSSLLMLFQYCCNSIDFNLSASRRRSALYLCHAIVYASYWLHHNYERARPATRFDNLLRLPLSSPSFCTGFMVQDLYTYRNLLSTNKCKNQTIHHRALAFQFDSRGQKA